METGSISVFSELGGKVHLSFIGYELRASLLSVIIPSKSWLKKCHKWLRTLCRITLVNVFGIGGKAIEFFKWMR